MQSRPTIMGQVAQYITDPTQRKALLNNLFSTKPLVFDDDHADPIFDMLLSMQAELTPEEILSYLRIQDQDGDTLGMMVSDNAEKKYPALLSSLVQRGLPAQAIIDHLGQANFDNGDTILHLLHLENLADLLCLLRSQEINSKSLDAALMRPNHKQENVIARIKSLADKNPAVVYRLISEGVIPESVYPALAETLKPLIKYIDENKLKPLDTFAETAARELTKRTIASSDSHHYAYTQTHSMLPNNNRLDFIRWLTTSSLPAAIKRACLDVKSKCKKINEARRLDHCLHEDDLTAYLELLSNIAKDLQPQETLSYLDRYNKHAATLRHHDHTAIAHFKLLTQLLEAGAEPEGIKKNIDTFKSDRPNQFPCTTKFYTSYFALLEKLVEKKASSQTIISIANKVKNLVDFGVAALRENSAQAKRYIKLLGAMANLDKNASASIAQTLLSDFDYPRRTTTIYLVEKQPDLTHDLVDLLIALKNNDVPLSKIHAILSFDKGRNNDYDRPKIPAAVLVEQARKDPALLFKLINHDLLPEKFLKQLKSSKEILLKYISEELPIEERVKALFNTAIADTNNNAHPLGKFFGLRRGIFPTHQGCGSFRQIDALLTAGILAKDRKSSFINPICALLIECTHNGDQAVKNRVHTWLAWLAERNIDVLFKLLKHDLLEASRYAAITQSADFRVRFSTNKITKEERRAILLDAQTDGHPLQKFIATSPELKQSIATEAKTLFGDQVAVANAAPPSLRGALSATRQSSDESPRPLRGPVTTMAALTEADLRERRACAEKFPALYETIYGEKPPKEWLKKPEPVRALAQPVPKRVAAPVIAPVRVTKAPPTYEQAVKHETIAAPTAPPASPAPKRPATPVSVATSHAALLSRLPAPPSYLPDIEENEKEKPQAQLA